MKAVELDGFEGPKSLRLAEIENPRPGTNEILIEVKAAGINYADSQQALGRYPTFGKQLPFVLGFEAAGIVKELGAGTTGVKIGDRVTAVVSSGGYAEFAVASSSAAIPIPAGLNFAEATALPVQGMSAYTLLKYAVKPATPRSILVQAAAGGVGLFLVQLARFFGVERVVALASSEEKLQLLKRVGVDTAINYAEPGWQDQVRDATGGKGADAVLQMSSGEVGEESFKLAASGGRIVLFGAQNYHDSISNEQVRQIIGKNQTVTGFNYPTLTPEQLAESLPEFLNLVSDGKLRIFAEHAFPLSQAAVALETLLNRKTIGKVVLTP